MTEVDEDARNSHLLFTIHVYQYRVETSNEGQNGGEARFHFPPFSLPLYPSHHLSPLLHSFVISSPIHISPGICLEYIITVSVTVVGSIVAIVTIVVNGYYC